MATFQSNSVVLVGTYGGDITHAQSAWSSTDRELTPEKTARLPQFLLQLAEAGHHTPFEKSVIHFGMTTEIASHIHILKHRIGVSLNSESARYKELKEDRAYIPTDWPPHLQERLRRLITSSQSEYHSLVRDLEAVGFNRKRAKESARFVLPYATQYQVDVSFNFRSFMHFMGLRNSSHAQMEIRNIAKECLRLVVEQGDFKFSLSAFQHVQLPPPEWELPSP